MHIITHTVKIPAKVCIVAVLTEYEELKQLSGIDGEATHTHSTELFHCVDIVSTSSAAIYTIGLIVGCKMRQVAKPLFTHNSSVV